MLIMLLVCLRKLRTEQCKGYADLSTAFTAWLEAKRKNESFVFPSKFKKTASHHSCWGGG